MHLNNREMKKSSALPKLYDYYYGSILCMRYWDPPIIPDDGTHLQGTHPVHEALGFRVLQSLLVDLAEPLLVHARQPVRAAQPDEEREGTIGTT